MAPRAVWRTSPWTCLGLCSTHIVWELFHAASQALQLCHWPQRACDKRASQVGTEGQLLRGCLYKPGHDGLELRTGGKSASADATLRPCGDGPLSFFSGSSQPLRVATQARLEQKTEDLPLPCSRDPESLLRCHPPARRGKCPIHLRPRA
jgi:hypothetical protein